MPRPARIHYYGATYHIMLRGNHRDKIFFSDDSRKYFYKILDAVVSKYSCKIHLFCLMDNHIHLVIEVGHIPLPKIMQSIASRYAVYYNKKMNEVGHLFQGRYKAKLVADKDYLLQLCFYIHNNPKEANLVEFIDDYPWSSHHAYLGKSSPSWLTIGYISTLIEDTYGTTDQPYLDFFNEKTREFQNHSQLTSDEKQLEMNTSDSDQCLLRNTYKFSHIELSKIAKLICEYLNTPLEKVRSPGKTKDLVLARNLILYFAHYRSRHHIVTIAYYFDRNPDAISRSLNRFLSKAENDKTKCRLIKALEYHLTEKVGNDPTF